MINYAGFEPGIIGIIIYLIFSAVMAKKKRERKLRSRGAPKSPPPSKENVFDLISSLKSELRKSFGPAPAIEFPPGIPESDDFEYTGEYSPNKEPETSYEKFEREKRLENNTEFVQEDSLSDITPDKTGMDHTESGLNSSLKAIVRRPLLQQGIIWKEILGAPIALRRDTHDF